MTDDRSHQTTSAYRRHQTTLIELAIDEDEHYTYLSANARESDDVRGDELKDDLFDAVQPPRRRGNGRIYPTPSGSPDEARLRS